MIVKIVLILVFILLMSPIIIERFDECVTQVKKIRSQDVDIVIDENKYIYEYSISKFRKLVKDGNLKRNNFIRDLNDLPEIKESDGAKYEKVFDDNDEIAIYREGKLYGFHIRFERQTVEVVGIVNDYTILTKHLRREDKTLEEIIATHKNDPVLSSYSGMSSSSDN
jgi:hypothetical protein